MIRIATNIFSILTFLALFVFTGCNNPATIEKKRIYPCYRLEKEPVMDGTVRNDPAWETIPGETGFVTVFIKEFGMNFPPTKQTFFKIGFTSDHLYLAAECWEPQVENIRTGQKNGRSVMEEEGLEIFLFPVNADTYRQFIMNVSGTRWSGIGHTGQEISSNDWETEIYTGEDFYSMEVKIPFKVLKRIPLDDEVWTGNICRKIISIVCPEDRKTSWSPLKNDFHEPESFGQIVFKNESLTPEDAKVIESRLRETMEQIFREKEESLEALRLIEEEKILLYKKKVNRTGTGITGVTMGKADLVSPPGTPGGEVWRYGLGFPFQIGPHEAALFCNIRMEGSGNIDFEIGSDVILFDDLANIHAQNAIPVSRFERGVHPERGNYITRKGPVLGGFVPIGAKLDDGSPHPHAGTGFGMCWAISHTIDQNGYFDYQTSFERYAELFQFAYDGEEFRILDKERVNPDTLLSHWNLAGNFITNAIPDGLDLLYVMVAKINGHIVSGVTRWRNGENGWRPVSFVPVTGNEETWSEPSLIRDMDGNLLFSARSSDRAVPTVAFDIAVWRSTDNGETWRQVIYKKNCRSRSPVSINRAVDGTPYIAANTPQLRRTREVLCLWPINEDLTDLECRITARDAPSEFGPAPSGSWWRIDHPTSAIIRLKDGLLHNILSYRIVDNGEVEGSAAPAPQTGCYVEEVFSRGEAIPIWCFQ